MAMMTIKKFSEGNIEHGMPLGRLDIANQSFEVLRGQNLLTRPEEIKTGDVIELEFDESGRFIEPKRLTPEWKTLTAIDRECWYAHDRLSEHYAYQIVMMSSEAIWVKLLAVVPGELDR